MLLQKCPMGNVSRQMMCLEICSIEIVCEKKNGKNVVNRFKSISFVSNWFFRRLRLSFLGQVLKFIYSTNFRTFPMATVLPEKRMKIIGVK